MTIYTAHTSPTAVGGGYTEGMYRQPGSWISRLTVIALELSISQQVYWEDFEDLVVAPVSLPPPPPPANRTSISQTERYSQGQRSAKGFIAYVVFAGNDIGVFYNWYVFDFTFVNSHICL
jgi:hypothetical protein